MSSSEGRNQLPQSASSSKSSSSSSFSSNNNGTNNSTLAMIIVLGMVGTAAGFTAYTKRSGQMLKQLEFIAKQKQRRTPPRPVGPMTKEEWDKIRPRFDKDEFI